MLVDIGGGPGHQCVALKKRYPDLRGRIGLQYTEDVIKEALFYPGIKAMVHDVWIKQPIKGIALASGPRSKDWIMEKEGKRLKLNYGPAHASYGTSCMTGLTGNASRSFGTSSQPWSKDSKILIDEMIVPR